MWVCYEIDSLSFVLYFEAMRQSYLALGFASINLIGEHNSFTVLWDYRCMEIRTMTLLEAKKNKLEALKKELNKAYWELIKLNKGAK